MCTRRVIKGWGQEFAVIVPLGTIAAAMPAAQLFSEVNQCPGPEVPGALEAFERIADRLFQPRPDEPMGMTPPGGDMLPPGNPG